MADTITARTGRVVLSSAQSGIDPGSRLAGELRDFGVDAATHEAVVIYDGALIRDGGDAIEKQRFEARVPVAAIDANSEIGRASCRERVCQYVELSVVAGSLKKKKKQKHRHSLLD